jgi:hypothetical protein
VEADDVLFSWHPFDQSASESRTFRLAR